jgi:hypothetical protein
MHVFPTKQKQVLRYAFEPIAEFRAGLEGEEKFRVQAAMKACFRAAR